MIEYGFTLEEIRRMPINHLLTFLAGSIEYHKLINGTPEPEPVKSIKFNNPAEFNQWLAEHNK